MSQENLFVERFPGCICTAIRGGEPAMSPKFVHLLHCPHAPKAPVVECDSNVATCTEDFTNAKSKPSQKSRVRHLMVDGDWHRADVIRMTAGTNGVPASEGLRRLRELRHEFRIEKRRHGSGNLFEYRLVKP